MPLKPHNRFITFLVICGTVICVAAISGIVTIEIARSDMPGSVKRDSEIRITGLGGILLTQLVIMIRQQINNREARLTRQDVRGVMKEQSETQRDVAEDIRTVRDQLCTDNGNRTPSAGRLLQSDEFKQMIEESMRKVLQDRQNERPGPPG